MYHELGKGTEDFELADENAGKKFIEAGKIAADVLIFGKSLIKRDVKIIDVLDKIEARIKSKGAMCAFPPQLSSNDVAAHSCPDEGDTAIIGEDVVKLDVGAHIEGYLADNALTVDLSGKWNELLKANKEALDAALKIAYPGTAIGAVGKTVQEVLGTYGFSPVRNLSGHGIGRYKIHTKPSIPNFDTGDKRLLEEGMTLAFEPFASTGSGLVYESGEAGVFMLEQFKPVRDPISRKVLDMIDNYEGLPFARKWITREFGAGRANFALRKLSQLEIIRGFPPLADDKHGIVSQMEKSVIIGEKQVILTPW